MADKKISEMTAASAYTGANEFYEIVQGGNTRQGSHALLKTYFDTLYPVYTAPASVTPTFTGFGTVSGVTAYTWRIGAILFFEIRFVTGTTTGAEARIGLRQNPGSGEVDVTSASTYPTLQVIGNGQNASNTANYPALIEASKTYFCVGVQSVGANAGLVKAVGSTISGNSVAVSFSGAVRIQGW